MVTRMEKAVSPKHKVGCEVDKITIWSSTKWKSVAFFVSRHNCKNWLASHSNHTRPILFSSKVTTLNTRSSKTSMWMILPEEGGTRTSKQNFGRSWSSEWKRILNSILRRMGWRFLAGYTQSKETRNKQVVMTYDMRSYSKGIISFYCEITGMRQGKLRKVSTPCLLENQMTDEELAHEGEMHAFAARILMRCLWLSRLARPDISFAVQRLASRITRWIKWEDDRQKLRLVSCPNSTCEYVMRAAVEPDQAPTLLVYIDGDFASCPYTSKSISGIVCVLQTGSSYFPLLWSSKKQSSTARSTTEAELIACASALFGEALNLHTMIESLTEVRVPVSFQQDNQAAITVVQSGYSAKLRHAGRVHRVNVASTHEQLDQGAFDFDYGETTAQLANGFTKVIGQAEWQQTLKKLCLATHY